MSGEEVCERLASEIEQGAQFLTMTYDELTALRAVFMCRCTTDLADTYGGHRRYLSPEYPIGFEPWGAVFGVPFTVTRKSGDK